MTAGQHRLPAVAHNRLLRRVDWRFLIGDGALGRVACLAPPGDPLHDALSLAGAEVINADSAPDGSCDQVVLVDPDSAALARAAALLRPGGVCYVEYRAWWRGWLPAARHALRTHGLMHARCWFVWPPPWREPATHAVPLDRPGPARWYLASRPRSRVRRYRLQAALQHRAWRLARRLGFSWPLVVAARKPSSAPADPRPAHLLLTAGDSSINKPIAFTFASGAREPDLVLKYARVPESIAELRHEVAAIEAIGSRWPDSLAGVPAVRFVRETGGSVVVGQEFARGRPVAEVARWDRWPELASLGQRWLINLAQARDASAPLSDPVIARQASALVTDLMTHFAALLDPALRHAIERSVATLPPLPVVPEHRDFWPGNVLLADDGALSVVDWERAVARGMPLRDLIFYLTWLVFELESTHDIPTRRVAYRRLIDPTTPTGSVVASTIAGYLHALGLTNDVVAPLRVLTWLLHARLEHGWMRVDHGDDGVPVERLRESLYFALLEEELRPLL